LPFIPEIPTQSMQSLQAVRRAVHDAQRDAQPLAIVHGPA
jgi:hypothetical protein